jgi:hypothetical protein
MTLNTYSKYLGYFTLKPREKQVLNNALAIEFPKSATILAGRVWIGYDEGSVFEAALKIWLQPKISLLRRILLFLRSGDDRCLRYQSAIQVRSSEFHPEPEYHYVSDSSQPKVPQGFSGNIYIGGVYNHRHYALTSQQDYYPLNELHVLEPIKVNAGSRVIIDRDIFNIDPNKTFNAWDCEVLLVVNE